MVGQIYPTELQLNKQNSSDTEAPFLDLNLSVTYIFLSLFVFQECVLMLMTSTTETCFNC